MIQPRRLVERFYYEVWNKGDETVANEILDPDFRFRGSLGPGRVGLVGFIGYMRSIRTALADFECIIDDLIEGDMRVAARMRFRGIHSGQFFGVPATRQEKRNKGEHRARRDRESRCGATRCGPRRARSSRLLLSVAA